MTVWINGNEDATTFVTAYGHRATEKCDGFGTKVAKLGKLLKHLYQMRFMPIKNTIYIYNMSIVLYISPYPLSPEGRNTHKQILAAMCIFYFQFEN